MSNKIRNEMCEWTQLIALLLSAAFIYKERVLISIWLLLLIIAIEFVCKDKE